MKIYLFFESSEYAEKIKEKIKTKLKDDNVIVINSREYFSINNFESNDILIVDAHIGKPKNQFKGLELFDDLIEKKLPCKIVVFSWFSIKQLWNTGIYFNFKNTYKLVSNKEVNYLYMRFPIEINTFIDKLKKLNL